MTAAFNTQGASSLEIWRLQPTTKHSAAFRDRHLSSQHHKPSFHFAHEARECFAALTKPTAVVAPPSIPPPLERLLTL